MNKKFHYKDITPKLIPKKIFKTKIFKFVWDGQINFTEKGLLFAINKYYKKYFKQITIQEIKNNDNI